MFKDLDPVLHSQLRLAVMSLLISVKKADFSFLKEQTNSTAGNLSVQLQKLKEVDYIEIEKKFKKNYPQTTCIITKKGVKAFENYVNSINQYIFFKNTKDEKVINYLRGAHVVQQHS